MEIDGARLRSWVGQVTQTWGYEAADADYLAETLVDANLRGVDSHGVIRLPVYRSRIEEGLVDPQAEPIITRSGATVRLDANGGAGQLAARAALEEVDALCAELGVASAAIHGSAHFGTAGFYARELARRGRIALVVSNSEPVVVPFGGRDALLGTNPIAFAAPTSGDPLSLDMATSTSAMGKVLVARSRGEAIPEGWGVDAEGHPTTDPAAVAALTPAGGPKGYGLGFLVEILAGVLTGAAITSGIGDMYTDFTTPQDVGHWMLALDVERFQPRDRFIARMDALIAEAHAVAPAPGSDGVLVPGEPEERTRRHREAHGVDLPGAVLADLEQLGRDAGIAFPSRSA